MAVYLLKESDDFKRYWYLENSLRESGEALWLKKNGTYFKGSWTSAPEMTRDEAFDSLDLLNKRFRQKGYRPVGILDYMPGW